MKILLVCATGMSTSILVVKMEQQAEEGVEIDAVSEKDFKLKYKDYDVILISPQLQYRFHKFELLCKQQGKRITLIDMKNYGTMNGKATLKQAYSLYDTSDGE